MFNVGDNWNNDLVNFMNELEEKMPKGFEVTGFDVRQDGITLDITVDDKNKLAKSIEQLRTFTSYQLIAMDRAVEAEVALADQDQVDDKGDLKVDEDDLDWTPTIAVKLTYTYKPWTGNIVNDDSEKTDEAK